MEELLVRHRKEQRDLQSRITQKKKNATKKTRKGVNDECENLERDLKERQQAEVDALSGNDLAEKVEGNFVFHEDNEDPVRDVPPASDDGRTVTFASDHSKDDITGEQSRSKKPGRQKARLARRAAEQEAQAAAAAEEAANLPDLREQETKAMKAQMEKLGLKETFIRPDGHCLFSACALGMPGKATDYQDVRRATADFISKHTDDFSPFLEESVDSYIMKMRDTAEWGGQLELQAIARSYNVVINVLQSDGRIEKIEPTEDKASNPDVWLAYYRHSFGLGEHYNALKKEKDG